MGYKFSFILRIAYSLFSFLMLMLSSNEYLSTAVKILISILYVILMYIVIKKEPKNKKSEF